jgi:CheY-like chemotaxis protein
MGGMMSESATVLVVDDDPDTREIVTTLLEDDGYHVDTASDGAEGLRLAKDHQPDAVILDVSMPVMDGWQFLEAWSALPPERRAPVVVVSAVRDWAKAMNGGAKGYLSKPFDIETLEATLDSVL